MTVERAAPQTFRGFWHGSPLGPYQLLCLHSFVAHGHRVEVFTYDRDLAVRIFEQRQAVRGCPLTVDSWYETAVMRAVR